MAVEEDKARAIKELGEWLEKIDGEFAVDEMPLPDRPFEALLLVLSSGAVEVHIGDEPVMFDRSFGQLAEPWFQALFRMVQDWYVGVYGPEPVRAKGNARLFGVVMVRDFPFAIEAPAHRHKVEIEGRQAWMYFEEGLGEGEEPLRWLKDGPNLDALDEMRRTEAITCASEIAGKLRFLHFRRSGVPQDPAAKGLAKALREYLERAARLMLTAKGKDLGPAWFDLQMAMESALKLALQVHAGNYPHSHKLVDLLRDAAAHGVAFDPAQLATWPDFKTMSDYRYSQGDPGTVADAFRAYRLALDLAGACMATIKPPINSGAGFLLELPPWLRQKAVSSEEAVALQSASTDV